MKNKLLFSVFVYFIILTLLSLGFWQIYRLNWKLELIDQIENSLKNDPVELSIIEKKKSALRGARSSPGALPRRAVGDRDRQGMACGAFNVLIEGIAQCS